MYSTCIFCHSGLGANEAIEHFPVGRRLAFDAAKGRLWVVCRHCKRWNLTPLEERWEAIEECERLYRGTALRVATDEIGLARPKEGIELIRIGKPLLPEFAAWRYGDQFGGRRKRAIVGSTVGLVGMALSLPASPFFGLLIGSVGASILVFGQAAVVLYNGSRVVGRVTNSEGTHIYLRRKHAPTILLLAATASEPWGLEISHGAGTSPDKWWSKYDPATYSSEIRGEPALRVASRMMPFVNRAGASGNEVKDAVSILEKNLDPQFHFSRAARMTEKTSWDRPQHRGKLASLPAQYRLALEMVSNEDSERRALEGELHLLEDVWKEAEEIANISDNMFLPPAIAARLATMRRREESVPPATDED